VGRPSKYDKIDLVQVEKLAGLGLIDVEIASVLGIAVSTLNEYKKKEEFSDALKRGKVRADAKVIESLYLRATGYDHEDIYFSNYKGEVTATPYVKHYPPDPLSMIFWLKNRRPLEWRDRQETEHVLGKDELTKVMAAYAEAFISHPGKGVGTPGDQEV
jgi:hypothetical protein